MDIMIISLQQSIRDRPIYKLNVFVKNSFIIIQDFK